MKLTSKGFIAKYGNGETPLTLFDALDPASGHIGLFDNGADIELYFDDGRKIIIKKHSVYDEIITIKGKFLNEYLNYGVRKISVSFTNWKIHIAPIN